MCNVVSETKVTFPLTEGVHPQEGSVSGVSTVCAEIVQYCKNVTTIILGRVNTTQKSIFY